MISRSIIRNEAFSEQFAFERVKVRSLSQVAGVQARAQSESSPGLTKGLVLFFSIPLGSV